MPFDYPWIYVLSVIFLNTLLIFKIFKRLGIGNFTQTPVSGEKKEVICKKKVIFILCLLIFIGGVFRVWNTAKEDIDVQELSHLISVKGRNAVQTLEAPPYICWEEERDPGFQQYVELLGKLPSNSTQAIFNLSNLSFSHQPLTSCIIYFISKYSFLTSKFILRLPSVVMGVLTIVMVFILAKELFNIKVALIAAFLLSINPLHIIYSRDLTPYAALCFLGVTSNYLFVLIFFKNRYKFCVLYAIMIIAAFFFHYIGITLLFPQAAFLIVRALQYRREQRLKKHLKIFFLCLLLVAYGFVLWSPIFFYTTVVTGKHTVSYENGQLFLPASVEQLLRTPKESFQVVAGLVSENFWSTLALLAIFLYALFCLRKNSFSIFYLLFLTILLSFVFMTGVDWYFVKHTGRIYRGYRYLVIMVPYFCIVLSYSLQLLFKPKSEVVFLKKFIISLCFIPCLLSNCKLNWEIVTNQQKPSFSQTLFFMQDKVQERDFIFYSNSLYLWNFLYEANSNQHNYDQAIVKVVRNSARYWRYDDYVIERNNNFDTILGRLEKQEFSRLWLIDVREAILKRDFFSHTLADAFLRYLEKQRKIVLKKAVGHIRLYLFNIR